MDRSSRLMFGGACAAVLIAMPLAQAQPPAAPPGGAPPPSSTVTPLGTGQLPFQPQGPPKDINERLERLRIAARRAFATAVDRVNRGVDATDRPVPPAVLTVENRFRDVGAIPDTQPLQIEWRLTNPTDAPVRIMQVRSTCACITIDNPEQTIAPGQTSSLRITFNPDGRMGVEYRELEILTDALAGGRFRVGFLVESRARVMIDPVSLNLGEARFGTGGAASTESGFWFIGRDPAFDVTGVSFNPPAPDFTLTRGIRETFKGDDGTDQVRVRYNVSFTPSLPLGKREATLEVKTNDAVRTMLPAVVTAEGVGDLRFRPGRMRLQGIGAGNAWQRSMRVDHRDNKPFRLLSVEAVDTPPEWGVVLDIEDVPPDSEAGTGPGYMIRVFGIAPKTDIPIGGILRIRTDAPNQAVVEYPFVGGSPRGATPVDGQGAGGDTPAGAPAGEGGNAEGGRADGQ